VIVAAHELKNKDVVERPGAGWHTISKVRKYEKIVRFTIEGKPYVLPRDYGVRIKG